MTHKKELKMCLGSSCFARGNKEILKVVKAFVLKHGLDKTIDFRGSHCFNKCQDGPNLTIDGKFYHGINIDNIEDILKENLLDN